MAKLKIVCMSDIHYSKYFKDERLERIKNRLIASHPSYILIAGDTIDSSSDIKEDEFKRSFIQEWFKDISKIAPVIITFGNHDFTSHGIYKEDYDENFWKSISQIEGVHVLHFERFFEDEFLYVCDIDLNFGYYFNDVKREDKAELLEILKANREFYENMRDGKLNIVLSHSPIYMDDDEVLEYLSGANLIVSGHMHNGLVPPLLDRLVRSDRGLIAPKKTLFPKNARGKKVVKYQDNEIILLISGGITKLARPESFLGKFNFLYPESIDELLYDTTTKRIEFKKE